MLAKKLNFMVFKWFSDYSKNFFIDNKVLIADGEDNIRLLIKFTNEEIKLYKEIKDVYQNKEFKDDVKVIIAHFKILKEF